MMVDGLVAEGADNESERRRGRQREKGRARKRVLYAFDSFSSACCSAEPLEKKKKVGRILASDSGGFPCSCEVASKNAGNFDSRRPTPKHDALPAEFLSLSRFVSFRSRGHARAASARSLLCWNATPQLKDRAPI